jgi:hypothetical protein
VKLRQHIDRAGTVEIVSEGTRTANGNLVVSITPAVEGRELARGAVIVEHPHRALILPHSDCHVSFLSLYPLAAAKRINVL